MDGANRSDPLTLCLAGDVMTGRGIDQILAHPSAPQLRERYVRDAREYVRLTEEVSGTVPRPVPAGWPWGDALPTIDAVAPDLRLINLETAVTRSDEFAPGKPVHYRMNPANLAVLRAARPDICVLANNHVLDLGLPGLVETLRVLASAGLRGAGAGLDLADACLPVAVGPSGGGRVLVLACGAECSGIPRSWAASPTRAGVNLLPDLSDRTADYLAADLDSARLPGDVAVVSIHWGSNWGYAVPSEHIRFAHRLVDGGVDVVHGHSSHHPRPIEVYRGKLVLYGCGDLINDYEGTRSFPGYRPDLRLLYFPVVAPRTGLVRLRMAALRARRMRLYHASRGDAEWLRDVLERTSRSFGTRIGIDPDGMLAVHDQGPVTRDRSALAHDGDAGSDGFVRMHREKEVGVATPVKRERPMLAELFDWLQSRLSALPVGRPGEERPIRVEDYVEDGHYVLRAELPGIDPSKDLDVTIDNGYLTLQVERREEKKEAHRSEFRYGAFSRSVMLPPGADENDVTASYNKGVLEVRVGMTSQPRKEARRIPITST